MVVMSRAEAAHCSVSHQPPITAFMARLLIIAVLLVAGAVCAPVASAGKTATGTAPSTPAKYFGFNDNAAVFGQLSASQDISIASQAGANSSRFTFDWRAAEPTRGNWQLAKYDAVYEANISKGIRPVFILMSAPDWAWAPGTSCSRDVCHFPPAPEHRDAWRAVVKKLLQRYPQMAALEIWNEPNYAGFWHGGLDPEAYGRLVIEAYSAAREIGSSVPVLGGSITNYSQSNSAEIIGHRNFLERMYEVGVKGRMDGIAIHPYPQELDLSVFYKMLSDVRDVRDAYGDDAPLWISEVGVTTVANDEFHLSENDQAVMLRTLYNELNAMSDVKSIWFHTLVEPTIFAATDPERGYGIQRTDLTPKPAYCMFAALRRTSYRCPSGVAAVRSDATQDARWRAQSLVQSALEAARRYRAANGSYAGLTTAGLNAINPALSATAPSGEQLPGPTADPTRIGVWVWGEGDEQNLLLCNASTADRSYCIQRAGTQSPVYGSDGGSIYAAAGATTHGASWWW